MTTTESGFDNLFDRRDPCVNYSRPLKKAPARAVQNANGGSIQELEGNLTIIATITDNSHLELGAYV
jgi:hypothetical protein